jgi:hypothetical protein
VRRLKKPEQHRGLLHSVGLGVEVFARQIGEAEVVVRRELPRQLGVDLGGKRARVFQQSGRLRRIEVQQHMGRLDLDAAARLELDLQRRVGVAHHAAGQELAGVIEQGVAHGADCPIDDRRSEATRKPMGRTKAPSR